MAENSARRYRAYVSAIHDYFRRADVANATCIQFRVKSSRQEIQRGDLIELKLLGVNLYLFIQNTTRFVKRQLVSLSGECGAKSCNSHVVHSARISDND